MEKFYEMKVAGLTRQLPIFKLNDELSIAAFVIFGDVELTEKTASALLQKAPEFDVIITLDFQKITSM